MAWRQIIEDVDKLVEEPLAFDAKQKVFEVIVREIRSAARVAPKRYRRHVLFFSSHNMLDSLAPGT
jgi:hypothetical protein